MKARGRMATTALAAAAARVDADEAVAAQCRWWVATERLSRGGERVLGPFPTRDLAMSVRAVIEVQQRRDDLWVVSADE